MINKPLSTVFWVDLAIAFMASYSMTHFMQQPTDVGNFLATVSGMVAAVFAIGAVTAYVRLNPPKP